MNNIEYNDNRMESQSSYNLCLEADRILQDAGFNFQGREIDSESAKQENFERRMKTGAFNNNSERSRRKRK